MARIYLDEDISRDTERVLRQYDHDVVHSVDMGNRAKSDPEHLMAAAKAGRVLVTFNRKDFREAHQIWVAVNIWTNLHPAHSGILTPWGQIPNAQWAHLVHDFVSGNTVQHNAPPLYNQMWEWRRQQQEWRRFGW